MVLVTNWVGLLPGTFRLSSHFLFRVTLAVPLWFCRVILNFSRLPLTKLSWFIGSGIPTFLAAPIGICEVIRGVMRPVALGLRLAANMLAGHVITSLVANCSIFRVNSMYFTIVIIFSGFCLGLFVFEAAVCVIQAFVFIMLLQIYIQETPTC